MIDWKLKSPSEFCYKPSKEEAHRIFLSHLANNMVNRVKEQVEKLLVLHEKDQKTITEMQDIIRRLNKKLAELSSEDHTVRFDTILAYDTALI